MKISINFETKYVDITDFYGDGAGGKWEMNSPIVKYATDIGLWMAIQNAFDLYGIDGTAARFGFSTLTLVK
jgi:hypothetical protein